MTTPNTPPLVADRGGQECTRVERVAEAIRAELAEQNLKDPDFLALAMVAIRAASPAMPEVTGGQALAALQTARWIVDRVLNDGRFSDELSEIDHAIAALEQDAGVAGPPVSEANHPLARAASEMMGALMAAEALAQCCMATHCYSRKEIEDMSRATIKTFTDVLASAKALGIKPMEG